MASGNPAKQLGIADRTGRIAPGLQADLVWTDERFAVRQTWVKGRTVARA
jgi:N-acetylglucosamine-6-phosphate deacetylase